MPERRMLLVHAHPDDESISTGATMAHYVDAGAQVTLVTCTAGELGEVLVPELAHLAADRDGGLGAHRREEIAEAMRILGVSDHRWLGGFGRFHDSGMEWHPDGHAMAGEHVPDNAFWHADLTEAADLLVEVIRDVQPQVVITYDAFGGYGHPDHIQAHRVTTYAIALAAARSHRPDLGSPYAVAKVYWPAISRSRMSESLRSLREQGDTETFAGMDPDGDLGPFAVADELIDAQIDGTAVVQRKMDALAAHRTQVQQDGPFFAGAESGHALWAQESFMLAMGRAGETGDHGLETDLFSGV